MDVIVSEDLGEVFRELKLFRFDLVEVGGTCAIHAESGKFTGGFVTGGEHHGAGKIAGTIFQTDLAVLPLDPKDITLASLSRLLAVHELLHLRLFDGEKLILKPF